MEDEPVKISDMIDGSEDVALENSAPLRYNFKKRSLEIKDMLMWLIGSHNVLPFLSGSIVFQHDEAERQKYTTTIPVTERFLQRFDIV